VTNLIKFFALILLCLGLNACATPQNHNHPSPINQQPIPKSQQPISKKTKANRPFTPAKDIRGKWAFKADPKLPNVLLIGDSISIGYTRLVRKNLRGIANVYRPVNAKQTRPANCGDTNRGIQNLNHWLLNKKWAVIHFNWGLHDLCYRYKKSKTQGRRDKIHGKISVPLPQYQKNLRLLVQKLKKTKAKLIFATTTTVPQGEVGRFPGDDIRYNNAAKKIMQKNKITINDLHQLTHPWPAKFFAGPGNVHFNRAGYQRIAKQVSDKIKAALKK